jgi:hypothetical protein
MGKGPRAEVVDEKVAANDAIEAGFPRLDADDVGERPAGLASVEDMIDVPAQGDSQGHFIMQLETGPDTFFPLTPFFLPDTFFPSPKGPRNNKLVNLVLLQLRDCAMTAACKMHLL